MGRKGINGEMAEARSEEEEENMMRDAREQVVRRQSNNSGGKIYIYIFKKSEIFT